MRRLALVLLAIGWTATTAGAAPPRRTLEELRNTPEPAWPDVKAWVAAAKVPAEILPLASRADGERALVALQITARSPMGAIALESGGILIDRGWIRVLGAGGPRMKGSLTTWNQLGGEPVGVLVVALDALGGIYAVNGGGLPGEPGNIWYLAPETLRWEDLGARYTQFLLAALAGKLSETYVEVRWKGWEAEVARLHPDQGIACHPPLWTREGKQNPSRKAVPLRELVDLELEFQRKLDGAGPRPGVPVAGKGN